MSDNRPPLFVPALFAKVFTAVLALAVAGICLAIWLEGTIATRDVVGTLLSAVIGAYWLHLLVIARQNGRTNRE
jgi:threonine/homoserine efflux transporter RhtA